MSADLRLLWESAGGNVPKCWEFKTIEELLEHPKSISVGVMYPGKDSEEGVPLVKVSDVKNGAIVDKPEFCISEEVDEEYKRTRLNGTELLITLVGNPGDCVVVMDEMAGWNVARALAVVRLADIEFRSWLRYVLLSKPAKHLIDARLNTTVQKTLNLKEIRGLGVPVPVKEERERITNIIDAFEDKILINSQTNQTLEQIAQAIFKSWFVDFEPVKAKAIVKEKGGNELTQSLAAQAILCGAITIEQLQALENDYRGLEAQLHPLITERFPNEQGLDYWQPEILKNTAALFPDALVESELGEIPEGWGRVELKDLAVKISKGTTPRKIDISKAEDDESINFLKVRDISDDGEIKRTGLDKIPESVHTGVLKRSILKTHDVLFSIAGTIGRVAIVEEDLNNSNCNQAVAFVRLKYPDKYLELCRLSLVSNRVQDEVLSKVVQGVQANFSLASLGEIKIIIPRKSLLSEFNRIIIPISIKQRLLLSEVRKLGEIRDSLLPKLLSGELSIDNTVSSAEAIA